MFSSEDEKAGVVATDDSRLNSSLAPVVLTILSVSVVSWILLVFVTPLSGNSSEICLVTRIALIASSFAAILLFGKRKEPLSPNILIGFSFITLAFPFGILISQAMGTTNIAFVILMYALAGFGQIALTLTWTTCLGMYLNNRETGDVVATSGIITTLLMIVWPYLLNNNASVILMIVFAAFAILFFFFLLRDRLREQSAQTSSTNNESLSLGGGVFASVSSQTEIYGAFAAILLSLYGEHLAFFLFSAALGFCVTLWANHVKPTLVVAPSFSQRLLAIGLIIALVICNIGTVLGFLEFGAVICICILCIMGFYFAATSLSLFVIEARELGYCFTKHVALSRIPAWFGFFTGFTIVGICLLLQVFPDTLVAIVADILIISVAISTTLHKTVDPDFLIEKDAVEERPSLETTMPPISAKPFKLYADQFADESGLTPREKDVFALLLKGRSTRAIQETLFISVSTVKTHIASIYRKTCVSSKQDLISKVEQGAKTVDDPALHAPIYAPPGKHLNDYRS